jgi:dephospho-CoA kinase
MCITAGNAGYEQRMVIGVTGKYCAGKNLVADLLVQAGYTCVDVDQIGHEALEAKKSDIIECFGDRITDPDGSVDRRKLGKVVFGHQGQLGVLESIVHPWMVETARARIQRIESGRAVLNAALLVKMGLDALCSLVIVVKAPVPVRFMRGLNRDNLSVGRVLQRIWVQRSLNTAPRCVDTVTVWNIVSRAKMQKRVLEILTRIGVMRR